MRQQHTLPLDFTLNWPRTSHPCATKDAGAVAKQLICHQIEASALQTPTIELPHVD